MPGADDDTTIAATIADVARAVGGGAPPPRALPYFALDHASGTPLRLVDELAARGIFRKYERVLDLGGGLGAATRYMAAHLGCTATTTGTIAEARAGRLLTVRARLERQVFHVAAPATSLPFATAAFTHVWVVDALSRLGALAGALAEAARVLRPGGHFAVQDIVPADAREPVARAALGMAGLVEVVERDVTREAHGDGGSREELARTLLERRLGPGHPLVRARRETADAIAAGRLRIVQLTARRP
jgi:SAM-dependent methyltransferase